MTSQPATADPVSAVASTSPGPRAWVAPSAPQLETDDEAWDEFVARSPQATWLQTTAWARVKRPNGWSAVRAALDYDDRGTRHAIGAQILVRRVRGLPWGLGYVPRGPVGMPDDPAAAGRALVAFGTRLREVARANGLADIRIEPEFPADRGVEDALRAAGWREARRIQWNRTRIVDLTLPEDALWADLRSKWRQYVRKAARQHVRVVRAGEERLRDFHRVYVDGAERAGMFARTQATFELLWRELAPRGMAHLFIAELEETGEPLATLLLTSAGKRAFEMYGGTTVRGEELRANYMLKWETMIACRNAGFREYDLWGLPHAGIAQFKGGFGGRELTFVGAWSLATHGIGHLLISGGLAARNAYVLLRYRGKGVYEGASGAE
jgi:peptidoglycan pentaglycine glycine transferase (the first glycine)